MSNMQVIFNGLALGLASCFIAHGIAYAIYREDPGHEEHRVKRRKVRVTIFL